MTNQVEENDVVTEPVSPLGKMFQDEVLHCEIICVIGFSTPVDLNTLCDVFHGTLLRHKRFISKVVGTIIMYLLVLQKQYYPNFISNTTGENKPLETSVGFNRR